jgi:hypothetical protein
VELSSKKIHTRDFFTDIRSSKKLSCFLSWKAQSFLELHRDVSVQSPKKYKVLNYIESFCHSNSLKGRYGQQQNKLALSQIFPIKSVLYSEVIKVEILPDVLLIVRSTARHAIHLQFHISTNALEIRVAQSHECIVGRADDCTLPINTITIRKPRKNQQLLHTFIPFALYPRKGS